MDLIRVPHTDLAAISATQHAVAESARVAGKCKLVGRVVNERTQTIAIDAAREAKRLVAEIEKCREEVKRGPLNLCRSIDGLAKQLSEPLQREASRIDGLLSGYVRELERQRREAEKAQREEEERQRREAAEKANRLRAEAEQVAQAEPDPVRAQQTLDLASAQAKQVVAAAENAPALLPAPAAPRASGLRVQTRWNYKVKDVWALAAHNRNLVRIEPSASAIKELIATGMRECPGLEIFEETVAATTAR